MSEADELLPPWGIRQRGDEPRGTRLCLVRHGECYANALGLAGGPLGDGGLTERGRAQAHAVRERLTRTGELATAAALYASTLPRAVETAEIIARALPRGLTLRRDEELGELRVGDVDGWSWREINERVTTPDWDVHPEAPCLPGGESLLEFYERSRRALTRLIDRHPGELVVVVTHGGVVEQAMKMYQGLGAPVRMHLRSENCSMTEIEFDGARRRLLRYNDLSPVVNSLPTPRSPS